jgi:transcription elongation factor GreA-like protein
MNFIIKQELAQAILNYLIGQRYADVYQLIDALKTLPVVKEPEPPKE